MSRWAYVNGRYVPHREASVHVEDRGYQFADGVYEVVLVHAGAMIDEMPHLDRLDRSLDELRIAAPMGRLALRAILREVVRRNAFAPAWCTSKSRAAWRAATTPFQPASNRRWW